MFIVLNQEFHLKSSSGVRPRYVNSKAAPSTILWGVIWDVIPDTTRLKAQF